MYNIRFHGRGGQGMKTASRILGSAFFLEGFEIQDAPRYGAERRGAPIFAYVRASREPINERGIIKHPDLVIVADDTLIPVPAAGVLSGITDQTVLLINSHESSETWRERLNIKATILILPIKEEAENRSELPFIGASCTGAAACLTGVISVQSLKDAIQLELAELGEEVVEKNIENAVLSFELMKKNAGCVVEGKGPTASDFTPPDWVNIPFEDASTSAPVIYGGLTSVEVRTGLWRTLRPVINYDHCKHCWWICSTFCPDSAINVSEDTPEVDYDHCKGCMICVAVCPSHAIETIPEKDAQSQGGPDS